MKHRNSECNVSRRRFLQASKKVAVGTLVGSSLSGVLWLDDVVAAIPVSEGCIPMERRRRSSVC